MEQFLNCSISGKFCVFQRYCIKEEDVINTDGSKTCPEKTKRSVKQKENKVEPFASIQESKDIGIVTFVGKNYIAYELDGKSICLRGKYNYNVGDKIEV